MFSSVVSTLKKPFATFLETSGTDMEPEPSDCETQPRDGTSDKPLFRLFVGWVPKLFIEQDLLPLFTKFGVVKDIIIVKDKVTGQPRGCAFVSYATKEEAEAAIAALDKGVHLPGALCPLEVRYARSHQYIQAGTGPEDNRQLFFARAPAVATEAQLTELFGQFGQVEEVNLFRERRTHVSKGCGFITMGTREEAIAAMSALDEKHLIEGSTTPLAVKWADPLLQIKKRRAVEDSNAENRMLFFAKVLRSANEDEVRALFSRFGRVIEVNLFRAFQGAPTTKGCGLVTMGSNDEAASAIDALDAKHVWDGMEAPMVVKWMDAALQKRRREEHLAAMRQGLVPSMGSDLWGGNNSMGNNSMGMSSGPRGGGGASLSQGKLLDAAAAAGMSFDASSSSAGLYSELLPAGCAPDAYKLFVGNVPKTCTEEELRPIFETVGPVVELVVVRDKFTHESKGSAFVWYTTKADADQAVLKFNMQRVLSDPTGEQDRPLVVRRANMRKPATALMMGAAGLQAGLSGSGFAYSGIGQGQAPMPPPQGHMHSSPPTLDLQQQQQGGMGLGFGSSDSAYYLQPQVMTLQVQQQQQQQQYMQPVTMLYQPGLSQQQQPVVSNSDNSNSGSFLLQPYAAAAAPAGAMAAGMASPMHQRLQQQQAYILSPQGLQPMLVSPHHSQSTVTGLGVQQQGHLSAGAVAGLGSVQPQGQVAAGTVAVMQAEQLGRTPSLDAGLGPMVQLSLQVSGSQVAVVSNHLYNIAAMSGADLATAPVSTGLFNINITGAQSQVTTARQLIMSVLSQVL